MEPTYTTAEVARTVRVDKSTLLRWLYAGKLAEPKGRVTIGTIDSRIWSAADLERAKAFREQNYRKRS